MAGKHARIFDWATALLVACAPGCYSAPQSFVSMVLRPDTRQIASIRLDSATFESMKEQFYAAFPNETALCLTGEVTDTVAEGERWLIVRVTGATPAIRDSVDQYHVYFPRAPQSGCVRAPNLVGAAHDHTSLGYLCTHSYPDADALFSDRRLLFTLVFCGDGASEALLQDGRRIPARWAPLVTAP